MKYYIINELLTRKLFFKYEDTKTLKNVNIKALTRELQTTFSIILDLLIKNKPILIVTEKSKTNITKYSPFVQQVNNSWTAGSLTNASNIKNKTNKKPPFPYIPSLIIVFNERHFETIIKEANKLHIPIIAINNNQKFNNYITYKINYPMFSETLITFYLKTIKKLIITAKYLKYNKLIEANLKKHK